MPTPSETLNAIRGAANVNATALASIRAQIPAWLAAVELWAATPSKGLIRDQLNRASADYLDAQKEAERLAAIALSALNQIGSGGDPQVLPPMVPWSTGELQIAFGVKGRPLAGQEIGRYLVVETVTWDALLSDGIAEVAATGATAITFSVGVTPIVRFNWAAGAIDPTIEVLVAQSTPGQVIIVTAAAVQDPTLAGIAGTLVGRRL